MVAWLPTHVNIYVWILLAMVIMVCWEVGRLHDFLSGGMRVCGNQQYHFALKAKGYGMRRMACMLNIRS